MRDGRPLPVAGEIVALCLLVWGLALLSGCQANAKPEGMKASPDLADLLRQGDELLALGEYTRAGQLFSDALVQDPGNLHAHYSLGVAASHAGDRRKAAERFQWVLDRGPADHPEVGAARHWLLSAGLLREARPPASSPRGEVTPPPSPGSAPSAGPALAGRLLWGEGGGTPLRNRAVTLDGVEGQTAGKHYQARTDDTGSYRFDRVPPGSYKLQSTAAGVPLWRLRVTLGPGGQRLDLTPENSAKRRDDFADAAR